MKHKYQDQKKTFAPKPWNCLFKSLTEVIWRKSEGSWKCSSDQAGAVVVTPQLSSCHLLTSVLLRALKALHPVSHRVSKGQTYLDFPLSSHERCIFFSFCAGYFKQRTVSDHKTQNLFFCFFFGVCMCVNFCSEVTGEKINKQRWQTAIQFLKRKN